jgi:hypothetical protein
VGHVPHTFVDKLDDVAPQEVDVLVFGGFFTQQPRLKNMLEAYFIIVGHHIAYVVKSQIILVKVNVKT